MMNRVETCPGGDSDLNVREHPAAGWTRKRRRLDLGEYMYIIITQHIITLIDD